ncbi:MAG: hypothetical protein V4793_01550 [Paraburkholderia tropica]
MSDSDKTDTAKDEQSEWATKDVSVGQFIEYLAEKHKGACPVCSARRWGVNTVRAEQLPLMPVYDSKMVGDIVDIGSPYPVAFLPMMTITCQECGLIQQFASNIVQKWVDGRK